MGITLSLKLNLPIALLLLSTCSLICGAQDLVADLRSKGIELVAPGDGGFGSASAACEFFF
jgi:hypothetical protein